jgi:hypothetical protein
VFAVDAAVLLPHPTYVVARVAERLVLLPRWCAGLRRVRYPAVAPAAGCVFSYAAVDARLTLHALTVAAVDADVARLPAPSLPASALVTHTATGDGLTLTWTLSTTPHDPADATAGPTLGAGRPHSWLRAQVEVLVDAEHPLVAVRTALCRTVARRVPADLERFRRLLERYESGRAPARPPAGDTRERTVSGGRTFPGERAQR